MRRYFISDGRWRRRDYSQLRENLENHINELILNETKKSNRRQVKIAVLLTLSSILISAIMALLFATQSTFELTQATNYIRNESEAIIKKAVSDIGEAANPNDFLVRVFPPWEKFYEPVGFERKSDFSFGMHYDKFVPLKVKDRDVSILLGIKNGSRHTARDVQMVLMYSRDHFLERWQESGERFRKANPSVDIFEGSAKVDFSEIWGIHIPSLPGRTQFNYQPFTMHLKADLAYLAIQVNIDNWYGFKFVLEPDASSR